MVATACYLIDVLGLRVGDEKDPDEADTVGATTLRPEHVTLHPTGVAEFRFLGKDAVRWNKKLKLPEVVQHNIAELLSTARPPNNGRRDSDKRHPTRDKPQLFPDIGSHDVNVFLSEALPGLTAKVFRTLHATERVKDSLAACGVKHSDPEHAKWKAANLANLEAAVFCNPTKQAPASWPARRERAKQRQGRAEERVQRYRTQIREYRGKLKALRKEAREKLAACRTPKQREKRRISYRKRIARAQRSIATAQERLQRALLAQDKLRARTHVAHRKRTWNLTTSLKSYIDPRVFYRWGRSVEYDVLERYYSKSLRLKFSWVREADEQDNQS
jgi:DNA topoisomerase-1